MMEALVVPAGHWSRGLSMMVVSIISTGAGSVAVVGAPELAGDGGDGGVGAHHLVLPGHDALDLGQGGGGEQHRHEEQGALLQGRHELAAEPLTRYGARGLRQPLVDRPRQAEGDHQADGEQAGREPEHGLAVVQGPVSAGS
jgi:hypothetical protein